MQEDIVGYLLGALDEDEMARFEAELDRNPELQARFQDAARSLHIFDFDREDIDPPPGLFEKTCSLVAGVRQEARTRVPSSRRHDMVIGEADESWSLLDLMVAASVMLVALMLFFPAINNSRIHAEQAGCQDNMRNIGFALIHYSESSPNETFPEIPSTGNLGVAGYYAPALLDAEFITDDCEFFCPSSANFKNEHRPNIPSLQEVECATGQEVEELQECMGGDYAYTLGYVANGKLQGIRNLGRTNFAILSDAPMCEDVPQQYELTHRNVLFECGGVRMVPLKCKTWNGDCLFENENGEIRAGCHDRDIVVAPSPVRPL